MRDDRIFGPPHNPGKGGWPTLRYYNKSTGYDGAQYEQKTSMKVCDEMKDEKMVIDFIEEQGKTYRCNALSGTGCDDDELALIKELSAGDPSDLVKQLGSVNAVDEDSKKKEKILKQLVASSNVDQEL